MVRYNNTRKQWTLIFLINSEQRQLFHQFLICDLAIRTLQYGYQQMEHLKLPEIYLPTMETFLKGLHEDTLILKRELTKQNIQFIRWKRRDQYFSDIHTSTAGNDEWLRYANQAMKTQVIQLIRQRI